MFRHLPDYQSSDEEEKIRPDTNNIVCSLTGWKDLLLKDQLMRSIRECGFQHPSQVQSSAIPYILQGQDLLCQAKSGMGKTAVFVIGILNQISPELNGEYLPQQCLVLCHCRQLAHQILKDFMRLAKYFRRPPIRCSCFFGGIRIDQNCQELLNADTSPHVVIGTPGRLLDLILRGILSLKRLKFLVVDECDKIFQGGRRGMRDEVQRIIHSTNSNRQMLMFTATLNQHMKSVCKKLMNNPVTICIDEGQLILHGLAQFFIQILEKSKFDRLTHLLDTLAFNQVIIFVNKVDRAIKLTEMLRSRLFNPICIHSALSQEQRIKHYDLFKGNSSRLLVATDLFGRGIDIERVNLVINYDFPQDRDTYLHRVGRAGRFGTKGMAINFIRKAEGQGEAAKQSEQQQLADEEVLLDVQKGFKVKIQRMPTSLDTALFM